MPGRDVILGEDRGENQSRQEEARKAASEDERPEADPRPSSEQQAEIDLLKSSGGDPLTQEG